MFPVLNYCVTNLSSINLSRCVTIGVIIQLYVTIRWHTWRNCVQTSSIMPGSWSRRPSRPGCSGTNTNACARSPSCCKLIPEACWLEGYWCNFMLCSSFSFLCRHTQFLRETRAAIRIQKRIRGFLCKTRYLRLCHTALTIQCHCRGLRARKAYMRLLYENKAIVVQRYARGWLARREYRRSICHIVITQSAIRRWLARRELKRLKVCNIYIALLWTMWSTMDHVIYCGLCYSNILSICVLKLSL